MDHDSLPKNGPWLINQKPDEKSKTSVSGLEDMTKKLKYIIKKFKDQNFITKKKT